MGTLSLLRRILRLVSREAAPGSPLAQTILLWCGCNGSALGLPDLSEAEDDAPKRAGKKGRTAKKDARKAKARARNKTQPAPWGRLLVALAEPAPEDRPSPLLAMAGRLAALLGLTGDEARLLQIVVALNRVPILVSLMRRLSHDGVEMAILAAELSGLRTVAAVAQSQPARLGLIELSVARGSQIEVFPTIAVDRVLDRLPAGDDALIESLVGARARATLALADFAEHGESIDLLRRTLIGALEAGAVGVNILLHGPPGTGKTELAKALAEAAGARLFVVGEMADDGEEPTRWDRLTALKLAQRVLANRRDSALLFDEMEDLVGGAQPDMGGGSVSRRDGSKVFVNRLLETNPVPTLWTSNAIENVDPAILRRMSFVMRMDMPPPAARRRIFGRIARDEKLALSDDTIGRLADAAAETTTIARNAVRTTRLAKGGEADAAQAVAALVAGIRHGRLPPPARPAPRALNLDLYESDTPIEELLCKVAAKGAPLDFSLLLTGPPGTGKTALAHDLARRLDRPLAIKRASDLMSKWVGETEQRIARAFAEAAHDGTVLLFDELDSLLFDRGMANRSWEISQVNELLTWMDVHTLPFIAATNHAVKLDPAALRRFVFKIELQALPPAKAALAFHTFFDAEAPPDLARIAGLTPGDFAVVARQLRFDGTRPGPAAIVERLAREAAAKPGGRRRIGF